MDACGRHANHTLLLHFMNATYLDFTCMVDGVVQDRKSLLPSPPPPPPPPPLPLAQGVWWTSKTSFLLFIKSYSLEVELFCPDVTCTFHLAYYSADHEQIGNFTVHDQPHGIWPQFASVSKDEAARVTEVSAQMVLPDGRSSEVALLPHRDAPVDDWELDIRSTPTVEYHPENQTAVVSVDLSGVRRCSSAGSCELNVRMSQLVHDLVHPITPHNEYGEAVYDPAQSVQRVVIPYHHNEVFYNHATVWLERTAHPCFSDCRSEDWETDLD